MTIELSDKEVEWLRVALRMSGPPTAQDVVEVVRSWVNAITTDPSFKARVFGFSHNTDADKRLVKDAEARKPKDGEVRDF